MFHYNLDHFWRAVYPIVNMHIVKAIRQVRYVKYNRATFGFLLSLQVTLTVIKTNVEGKIADF